MLLHIQLVSISCSLLHWYVISTEEERSALGLTGSSGADSNCVATHAALLSPESATGVLHKLGGQAAGQ